MYKIWELHQIKCIDQVLCYNDNIYICIWWYHLLKTKGKNACVSVNILEKYGVGRLFVIYFYLGYTGQ